MKTIGRDFGDTARKVYAVASGALGNGKTCVVNSNGTVSVVAETVVSQAVGSVATFESAETVDVSVTFDSSNNKIVIVYRDRGNSQYGTAVVGTVSGTDISFGTPVVFNSNSATMETACTFDSNANKVVVIYRDTSNNHNGLSRVGTVSGTSISFGNEAEFQNGSSYINTDGITFDSNSNKVVVVWQYEGSGNKGKAAVGTVSGTSISFGTAATFNNASTSYPACAFDSNSNKVVVVYKDTANSSHGTAIIGTVSGTDISFGSEVVFEAAATKVPTVAFDSTNNKVVIAYQDDADSDKGKAIVGTVSGTGISFGTAVEFSSASVSATSTSFDSTAGKIVIAFDDGSGGVGSFISGAVSGTSISFDTKGQVESGDIEGTIGIAFDSNAGKTVIAYKSGSTSNYGKSNVITVGYVTRNLTAENYIGITPSAYPTGAGAEIQTKGAVNEEQSGLTAGQSYFVQTDGTLGTTAASPSVFAGTAVSATKIIVKG